MPLFAPFAAFGNGLVNGGDLCPSDAYARSFWVSQAVTRLRVRGEGWGYLAIHRQAVVGRCECCPVPVGCSAQIGHDWYSTYAPSIIGNKQSGKNRSGVRVW